MSFDLFAWWAATISGGIVFLIVVSIYLYANSKIMRKEKSKAVRKPNVEKDFIFVWVLIGLLVFYIISVSIGSSLVFAAGNIMVEVLLVAYLVRNRQEKPQQVPRSESQ